jgi:hypothetical protein
MRRKDEGESVFNVRKFPCLEFARALTGLRKFWKLRILEQSAVSQLVLA